MNRNFHHLAFLPGMALIALITCGFTWGLGPEDRCANARKIGVGISDETPPAARNQAQKDILKLCPDSGVAHYVNGLALETGKDIPGAIEEYRTASAKDPLQADAKGRLGLLLLQQGSREEASVALFESLQLKSNPQYSRALAGVFLENKLYALALHQFKQAQVTITSDASVLIGMAQSYLGLGDRTKARATLLEARHLEPTNVVVRLSLASIYQEEKLYDQALIELKHAVANDSGNKDIHYRLASLLELMAKLDEAEKEYHLAGIVRNVTPVDHLRNANKYLASGDFPNAAAEYASLLLKKPDSPGIRQKLGDAWLAAGQDNEAISAYEDAVSHKEGSSQILYNLGTLYERKGDLDKAVTNFSASIKLDAGNSDARRRLAEIYALRGDFTSAINEYQELVARHGDNPLSYYKLARLLEKKRNYKPAINAYNKAIELDADNIEAHRDIARLYLRLKMSAESEKQFREVLRIDPNDSEARNTLISISVKNRQYDVTTQLLEEDARLNPQNPDSQYRLGVMYAFKKNIDGAFTQFQETLKLKQDHAKALNAIGKVYLKKGEKEKARESFAAAKSADPNFLEPVELLSKLSTTNKKPKAAARKGKSVPKKKVAQLKGKKTTSKKKHK